MQIKSLLLGSAAALAAVTGARAADAPVTMVEPEPVEYVRVCDVYGTGFFYIPGTETCLQISGSVRFRIAASTDSDDGRGINNRSIVRADTNGNGILGDTALVNGVAVTDAFINNNNGDSYRAGFVVTPRLDFDAREETEYGQLRAKIGLETDYATSPQTGAGDSALLVKEAYIQLGGLTMGLLDSLWTGGEGGISDGLLTDNDWAAGDFRQNRISYTFAANGFTAAVSVEDDGDGDFTPDVIGKVAYKSAWGGAYIAGVYEEDGGDAFGARFGNLNGTFGVDARNPLAQVFANTFGIYRFGSDEFTGGGEDGAFVLKGGVQLQDLITAGSILKVEGHYAFDPSSYAVVGNAGLGGLNNASFPTVANGTVTAFTAPFGGVGALSSRYQVGAAYQQNFDKLRVAVSGVYGETFDLTTTFVEVTNPVAAFAGGAPAFGRTRTLSAGNADYWGVSGDVGYRLTKNFDILGTISYRDVDMPAGLDDYNQTAGFLQFKRFF